MEIRAAQSRGGERYRLTDGKDLGRSGGEYLYEFRLDRECFVPDECSVRVETHGQKTRGKVISIEGFEIMLALDDALVPPLRGWLAVELWYILERLRDRLRATAEQAPPNGYGLLDDVSGAGPVRPLNSAGPALPRARGLNAAQWEAVRRGAAPGIHFLWGPPGTGKTTTVGHLAGHAARSQRRVLIVAYSNVAVDVAMLAVTQATSELAAALGSILRLGTPRLDSVREHPTLTVMAVIRQRYPQLARRFDELLEQRRRLAAMPGGRHQDALERVRAELRELRDEIRRIEDALTQEAIVLGCTLARLATSEVLAGLQFDTVVLDEASMASLPFAALAALEATNTLVFAGDFRQLPPVVLATDSLAQRYLARSVFDYCGLTDAVRVGYADPRMVMLSEQYRMHPDIAQRVSRIYYGGKLTTSPAVAARSDPIAHKPPFPRHPAYVVDISALHPACLREPKELGQSCFNVVSALITLGYAAGARAAGHTSVAIIAPFRAQARVLQLLASGLELTHVQASSVHRFQGGEADVVIVDLTTADGHSRLGPLLEGDTWTLAGRLLNVAISRPRGKLIVIADLAHLKSRVKRTDALFEVLQGLPVRSLGDTHLSGLPHVVDAARRIEVFEGGLYSVALARHIAPAQTECLVTVRDSVIAPLWVQRSSASRVVARGIDLHQSWYGLPNGRVIPG
ncbi:MAG TPA: AAA domain-containing protein, partial [Chloroflexota bacterium]|nr:AAA domain-containing protein [Chloroflexota bacterium]